MLFVDKREDCWVWTGKLFSNKYGCFSHRGKSYLSHRMSYLLFVGEPGEVICHRCDNRQCVRPEHLYSGTQSDNIQDMLSKGRNVPPSGERSGKSKLTWDDVDKIRLLKPYKTNKELSKMFDVSAKQISVIVSGKQWINDGRR